MSTTETAAAIRAVLNAAIAPAVAYEVDMRDESGVVQSPSVPYVTFQVTRRFFGGTLKMGAATDVTGYRLMVRGTSQTSVADVRTMLDDIRAAVEFQRITVGAGRTTPIQFETEDDPVRYDDGWFSGDHAYTFTI